MGYFNDEDFVVQNDKLWDLGKKITSKTDELDANKPKPTWDVNGDTNSASTASDYTGVDSAGISKEDMSGEHGEPLSDYLTNKVKYVAVSAYKNASSDKTIQKLMNLQPGEKITADMFADTNNLVTENFDTFKGALSHVNDKYVKATDMYKDYMANDEEKLNESRNLAKTINEAYGRDVIDSDTLLANKGALDNARRLTENIQKHQELIGSNNTADVQQWLMEHYPELANLSTVDGAIALANLKSIQQTAGIIDSGLIGAESASIQAERSNILLQHFLGKEFTYEDKKRLATLTDRYATLKEQMPSYGASPLANIVGQTVEQFGGMGQDVLAGQAVAGGAGIVAGGYTLLHTGSSQAAKLAFKTAYKAAQPIAKGVSELSMFKRQVGEKFYEYENMSRDSAGNEALLSTDEARTYAILETAVETGIEFYNYNDVMNLLGGGAKAKVAAIVSENKGNKEAIMAGIKQIVANKAGSFAKVMIGETSEEAEQNLTDNLFHNFIVSKYGSDKEKLYSKQEMANSSIDAAIDAVPSVFGMTVAGAATSSLSFVRKVARANVIKENYSQEQINNAFMSKTLTDLAEDAKTNELAKKQPEIYAQVVKEEMKKNGMETVSVDTELLAKEDGGLELLNSIGEKMGMSGEKIASTISSGASLDVPMEVYCQTVLSGDMANTVIDMSSNSPDIACPKRAKDEAERIKKIYADIVKQDAEDKNSLINAVVNSTFATDSEKELATEILTAYSDDPEAGRQKYLKQLEAEYAKYLEPYVDMLNEGWGKGVAVMQDDITNPNSREEGRGVKVSNNAPWYGEWYKEHKRQPTKADLQKLAYDLLTGTNDYGVQGFGYELITSPETQEGISQGFEEQKVKLDRMLSDIQALKDMQGKMEKLNLNAEAVATGLSPEAFGAYKAIEAELSTSANEAVRKAAKMNAVLLARHAQRMVEAGLFKSVGEYFGGVTINGNAVYGINSNQSNESNTLNVDLGGDNLTTNSTRGKESNVVNVDNSEDGYQSKTEVYGGSMAITITTKTNYGSGETKTSYVLNAEGSIVPAKEIVQTSTGEIKRENSPFVTTNQEDKNFIVRLIAATLDSSLSPEQRNSLEELLFDYCSYYYNSQDDKYKISTEEAIKRANEIINGKVETAAQKLNQSAWHGSPHVFEKFDLGYIGTGEGAQVHGWGLYFAQDEEISRERYKDRLTGNATNRISKGAFTVDGVRYEKFYEPDEEPDMQEYWEINNGKDGQYFKLENEFAALNALYDNFDISKAREDLKSFYGYENEEDGEDDESFTDALDFLNEFDGSKFEEAKKTEEEVTGSLFEVDIPEDNVLLDEQKPLNEQPQKVRETVKKLFERVESKNTTYEVAISEIRDLVGSANADKAESIMRGLLQDRKKYLDMNDEERASQATRENSEMEKIYRMLDDSMKIWISDNYEVIYGEDSTNDRERFLSMYSPQSLDIEQARKDALNYRKAQNLDRLSGKEIYDTLSRKFGGDKEASLVLNSEGVKGITYDGQTDGRCFVVFDDIAVNIINRYNQEQNQGEQPLGTISIMENGKRIIDLFSNANESTLLHESGHLFLDDLRRASQQPNADKQIISDWNTVREWLGMTEGQEKPTTAQHEKFADGFVAYLKTGEAPTRGLKGAFQSFKSWLIGWYKDFTQAGGAKPTKEVAEVMGRMIASQDEVDIENKRRQVESFTKSKGYDILDEETAKKLVRWQDKAKKEAEEKVLAQALEDIEKGEKEFNAQVLDNIRRGVEEDLAGENIFKAEAALEAMNGDTNVLQNFGYTEEQYRAELKARGGSFEKAVELEMKNARQEVNSKNKTQDEIQALAQKAVRTSKYREMAAALELQALTKLQEKLAKEAPNKKDNELKGIKKAIRVVRDEALGTVKTYREAAQQALAGMTIGQATDSKMWERKEAEKTQESLKAMAKGDWQAALEAKRQQLLYASMARQSFNLKDKAEKMAKTVLKRNEVLDKGKEKMPASERYYYQHLSYVMGLRKTDAIAPMTLIPFRELMKANNTIEGESDVNGYGDKIDIPDFILQLVFANKPINNNAGYQGLNFEQLKALSDFLKTLYHTGINKDNLVAIKGEKGESLKVSDVVSDLVVEIGRNIGTQGNGTTDLEKKSNIEHAEAFMGSFFLGELLHPETVLQRIDGYIAKAGKSINGIANKLIFEPMNKARSKEILMTSDTTAKLKAIFGVYSNSELDDIRNKKTILLGENLLTKEQVISMALNCGTEKNLQRLVDGLVISEYEQTLSPEEAHKFRYKLIMEALSSLDGRDWKVVQDIWALFDSFYEDNSRQEEITRGIPLGKEAASPFSVVAKDGTKYDLKGGYFPIVYDAELSSKAADQKQDITAKSQMSGNARFGIGRGSTKARSTKVTGRPLLFSFDVISRKLDESIHNICFRATVRDINRIISNEQFKQALTNATSKAQYKVVADWVRDCWATEIVHKGAVGKIAQALRHNITQAVLGFRLSTALMNICNLPLMVEQVGIGNFFGAYKDFMSNLKGNYNFINQLSPFMANRAETMDINMRESYVAQQKKLSKGGISDFIKNQSFKVIGFTDNIFAYPLWLSEYKRVFNEDMQAGKENIVAQQNAIQAGDRAARRIIGSGEVKDLAPIQKNKDEFYKSVTMFYTFYSAVYNQMANKYFAKEQNKRTKNMSGYQAFAPIVRGAFYYWIMQSALEGTIRGLLSKDDNKDAKWWAKHFGRTALENGLAAIPIVRDLGRAGLDVVMGGYGSDGFKMTSAYDGLKRGVKVIGTAKKTFTPDNKKNGSRYTDWVDVARDVGKTFNSFTGTPDMITDSITTFARYAKNDFDNSFWEYVGNTAMDRKLQKTRDVRGRKVPKAKLKKKK